MDVERLRSLRFFDGIDDSELVAVAGACRETSALPGAQLAGEGDYGYAFFVVLEGEASVRRDGDELARLQAGDAFGELAVAGGGSKRNADVVAETRVRLAKMMIWDFDEICRTCPTVAARIEARVAELYP